MHQPLLVFSCAIALCLAGCGDDAVTKKPSTSPGDRAVHDQPVTTPSSTTDRPAADNAAKNQRDDGTTITPVDQGMSEADTAITAAVRSAVVAEAELSVNAQNAKIVTRDGVVTLRGPVASTRERTALTAIAVRTPGVKRVDNQLEVVSQ